MPIMTPLTKLLALCLFTAMSSTTNAWVSPRVSQNRLSSSVYLQAVSSTPTTAASGLQEEDDVIVSQLGNLLQNLDGPDGGDKLLAASSTKWREAIYRAVGAPSTAGTDVVGPALRAVMARSDNQFGILMKENKNTPFVANFPSDPVVTDEANAWVECRLRHAETDELLVTMGISLVREQKDGKITEWLINALDWQDFRQEFYPGLSGREWLRAF